MFRSRQAQPECGRCGLPHVYESDDACLDALRALRGSKPLQAPALPKRPKKPPTVQIEDAPLPRLVSINRACELIGMTRHTLYNWDGSGDCAARIR